MLFTCLQIAQVQSTRSPTPQEWGAFIGYLAGVVIAVILIVHGSGKLMEAGGQNYWFGVAIAIMFNFFGLIASFIVYLYRKYTRQEPAQVTPRSASSWDDPRTWEDNPLLQPQLVTAPPLIPVQPVVRPAPAQTFTSQSCKRCGETIRQGADFCLRCGEAIPVPSVKKKCSSCGGDLLPDAEFCHLCGNRLA
jgi:hypothetical protein